MLLLGIVIGILIGWFCVWAWYAYPDNREKFRLSEAENRLKRKRVEAEIDYINEEIDDALMRRQQG